MRLKPKHAWFLAFAAVFAALAGYVFWGTWGISACPVMPDCPTTFPADYAASWCGRWVGDGRFVPGDIAVFLGSPYLWIELQYALAAFFAALGMAYFLRGRGLSRAAAYGAGLLLAFCGYWFSLFSAGHLGWFQWMTYGVFAFGLIDRALEKGRVRHWLLLGAVLAWGSFYQPDLWLLFTAFQAAYFVFRLVIVFHGMAADERRPAAMRWARCSLLALAVFVAIGLPSFRNAIVNDLAGRDKQIEEGQTIGPNAAADDAEKRWIFVTNWSLPPDESLEFVVPRLNGDTSCPTTLALGRQQGTGVRQYTGALGRPLGAKQGNYRQHSLYVGWVTCLLAVLGVVFAFVGRRSTAGSRQRQLATPGSRRSTVLFFAIAAIVFWLFSMGRYCEPVYRLVYALPMGDYLRAPVKWHHLTEFCLATLAGFGLEYALSLLKSRGLAPRVASAAVCAVALFGACDLARIDRLYCAVVDLTLAQSDSPAANEVLKRGGGKVADLLEGGNGLVAWSFTTRRIEMTGNPADPDVRFVWVGAQQLADRNLSAWLKARGANPIGAYAVSQRSIRAAGRNSANVVLLEIPGAPAKMPSAPETPPVTCVTWLGMLSLAATIGVSAYGAIKS